MQQQCQHEPVVEETIMGDWTFCKHCHKEIIGDVYNEYIQQVKDRAEKHDMQQMLKRTHDGLLYLLIRMQNSYDLEDRRLKYIEEDEYRKFQEILGLCKDFVDECDRLGIKEL